MSYGQITLLRVVIFLALSWFVSPWFLVTLPVLLLLRLPFLVRRARILAIVDKEYQYRFRPKAPQIYILKNLEPEIGRKQFNDSEIATAFMAAMCNSVGCDTEEGRAFCQRVRENARRLHYQEKAISKEMLIQLDNILAAKGAIEPQ